MKNISRILIIYFVFSLFIVGGRLLYAECQSEDGEVTATMTNFFNVIEKLEISKNGGATYFTIYDNNTNEVDLVAVSGQNVGTVLGTNSNIPAGRYNYARATVANSRIVFNVSCTNPGEHGVAATGILTIGDKDGPFAPDSGYPIIEEGAIDITVTAGGTTNAVMDFDAALSYAGSTFRHQTGGAVEWYPGTFVFDPAITIGE